MLERDIEAYLVSRSSGYAGMLCEKFNSPMRRFVPDRIVTYMGRCYFIELKRPGKAPNDGQLRDHKRRSLAGFKVYVIDSKEAVDKFFDKINQRTMKTLLENR